MPVAHAKSARISLALLLACGCAQYRSDPLLSLEAPGLDRPLELSGVALLPDGHVVAVAEGVADVLYAPDPDVPLRPRGLLDLFPLRDGRDLCGEDQEVTVRCAVRHFRAEVRLQAQPITWLARDDGVGAPFDVEDLAAFGPERVIGVTKYSSVGRRTGFRRDLMARSRRTTERLFVLERRDGGWVEQDLPEITRLRDSLSDWGRANCNDDLLVEGIAWDSEGGDVFVGLSRCAGSALRVLRYPLSDARLGAAATLSVLADGSHGTPLGPAEGLTGLSAQNGKIYAVSAWDSYGYDTEPAFGGRLWRVDGDRLTPLDLADIFHDRPSALAVLPSTTPGSDDVEALVLFDNDADAGSPWHPNATVLTTPTAAPHSGAWARLLSVEAMPDALPLGLNGFDLRWFARDHRLAEFAVGLARNTDGKPGAWTRALGGRWQVEIGGSLGMWARAVMPWSDLGRNRQAVALTDYAAVPGLRFSRYRVRISVVPRDRERENPSVAALMEEARPAYRLRVPIPTVSAGAGVLLQGFEIDTAARAEEGICLAGMEIGASLADLSTIEVQSTVIGGLCNDFDNRGPTLRHGRTTSPDGGVSVVLDLAVVEGGQAKEASVAMWDRALPAPPKAAVADRSVTALRAATDAGARASLHCGRATALGVAPLPRQPEAPPDEWHLLGQAVVGDPVGLAGSLRGFAFALDPVGFDPGLTRPLLTETEALSRNNYVYRYLARLFVSSNGTFAEGGLSHGIHKAGPMRDNARPSALYTRLDATTFASLPASPASWDLVAPAEGEDPNLLPEDGFVRWATAFPLTTEPACSPGF